MRVPLLLVIGLVAAMPGRARAYACPDDFVPRVAVGILRGTQVVRTGDRVPMRAATGDCKYDSLIDPVRLEITVAAHPDGPFAPLPVTRDRHRFVWRPMAPGTYFVRVTIAGRPAERLRPGQLAFVVVDPRAAPRVRLDVPALPRVRFRAHLLLEARLPELEGRDGWEPPVTAVRAGRGPARIPARIPLGRWSVTRGSLDYEKNGDVFGPGELQLWRYDELGEIEIRGDGPVAIPSPPPTP